MRSIHTFVLRLLYDTQDPEELRGSLQAVDEKEAYTFVGDKELCALAARLIRHQLLDKDKNISGEGQRGSRGN